MRLKSSESPMNRKSEKYSVQLSWKQAVSGIVLIGIISGITVLLSSAQIPLPERESELIISFKAQGAPIYSNVKEEGELPRHMQRRGEQRVESRADVAVQVADANEILFTDRYRPKGIFRRGYSSGIINIPLDPGVHILDVKFGDYIDNDVVWNHSQQQRIEIKRGERVVLKFDEQRGFQWYERNN